MAVQASIALQHRAGLSCGPNYDVSSAEAMPGKQAQGLPARLLQAKMGWLNFSLIM